MNKKLYFLFLVLVLVTAVDAAADSMSMITYRRLQAIEALIAEENYPEAGSRLEEMLEDPPGRLEDQAYLYYTAGMFYLQLSQFDKTKQYLSVARGLDRLPEKTTIYLLQTLAGISMQEDRFEDAVNYFQACFDLVKTPDQNIYLGMGTACYYSRRYNEAARVLEQAMAIYKPREATCLVLFSAYYELGRLEPAGRVLEKMIRLWPGKEKYWLQLASLYIEREKYEKSLEIMQAAWVRGYLVKEKDVLQYVFTLYEANLPYKSACALKAAMDLGVVPANRKNNELLSTMYQEAKERQDAIVVLKRAAACSDDGKNDLYIAQLYFEMENAYDNVIEYAATALEKGIQQEGSANMLIAVAYSELGQVENARKYLRRASRFEQTRDAALQWLKSLE